MILMALTAISSGPIADGGDAIYGEADSTSGQDNGFIYRIGYDGSGFRVLAPYDALTGTGLGPLVWSDGELYVATSQRGLFGAGRVIAISKNATLPLYDIPAGARVRALASASLGAVVAIESQYAADYSLSGSRVLLLARGQPARTLTTLSRNESPLDYAQSENGLIFFAFASKGCSTAIYSIDRALETRVVWRQKPDCTKGSLQQVVLTSGGVWYGETGSVLYRLNAGGVLQKIMDFARHNTNPGSSLQPLMIPGPDDSVFGVTRGDNNLNCGAVFTASVRHPYRAIFVFGVPTGGYEGPLQVLCGASTAGSGVSGLIRGTSGMVYATLPPDLFCGDGGGCGSLVRIGSDGLQTLHTFVTSPPPRPVIQTHLPSSYTGPTYCYALTPFDDDFNLYALQVFHNRLSRAKTMGVVKAGLRNGADGRVYALTQEHRQPPGVGAPYYKYCGDGIVEFSAVYRAPALPAGMYQAVMLNGQTAWQDTGMPMYIPPPPREYTAFVPGRQFVSLAEEGLNRWRTSSMDPNGNVLGTRVLTLLRVTPTYGGMTRLAFSNGANEFAFETSAKTVADIPGFSPLVTDAELFNLRQKYRHRTLYPRPGARIECIMPNGNVPHGDKFPLTRPLPRSYRVRDIVRLGAVRVLGDGPEGDAFEEGFIFESRDPIVVIFDSHDADCAGMYSMDAAAWDFERAYATHPIATGGDVKVGMTREMVADALGFPPGYGTVDHFDRLDVWDYQRPGPFGSKVIFRNGLAVEYDPPGNLP